MNMKYIARTITGQCPSCLRRPTTFRFHGQQLTDPMLWKELGRKVNLYICDNCGTAISERRILHQHAFRRIDGILHRRQLVQRTPNPTDPDTYKWVPIDGNAPN